MKNNLIEIAKLYPELYEKLESLVYVYVYTWDEIQNSSMNIIEDYKKGLPIY